MKRREINKIRKRKIKRVRAMIFGTGDRPRMAVKRSHKHIYVQLINDENGTTLASASSLEYKGEKKNKTAIAEFVGKLIAEKAKQKGIEFVVFDKRWYKYHGRVKILAESARKNGLKF